MFRFFFQSQKLRATSTFFGGFFLILLGWTFIGLILEFYGFFLLFGWINRRPKMFFFVFNGFSFLFRGFLPIVINFLRRIPILGSILLLPGLRQVFVSKKSFCTRKSNFIFSLVDRSTIRRTNNCLKTEKQFLFSSIFLKTFFRIVIKSFFFRFRSRWSNLRWVSFCERKILSTMINSIFSKNAKLSRKNRNKLFLDTFFSSFLFSFCSSTNSNQWKCFNEFDELDYKPRKECSDATARFNGAQRFFSFFFDKRIYFSFIFLTKSSDKKTESSGTIDELSRK